MISGCLFTIIDIVEDYMVVNRFIFIFRYSNILKLKSPALITISQIPQEAVQVLFFV